MHAASVRAAAPPADRASDTRPAISPTLRHSHTALNAVRSRTRRARREANYGALEVPASVDPAEVAEITEQRQIVRTALARMPRKGAAVLALRYGGLSYAEVAQALGVNIGQIGTLLRRAEAALRREVESGTSR